MKKIVSCALLCFCLCAAAALLPGLCTDAMADGEVVEVDLDGFNSAHSAQQFNTFEEGWNYAIGEGNLSFTTVKLLANVTAGADDTLGTSFGAGAGFGDGGVNGAGCILVPDEKTVHLDLNDFTLSRGLAELTSQPAGYVIMVKGTLVLSDGSVGNTGKITGGNCTGDGGGVYVSAGGYFSMYPGSGHAAEISGNKAAGNGAGVYVNAGGEFKAGSNAKITGNYKGSAPSNVYLTSGTLIDLSSANPTTGMSVGVTTQTAPTPTEPVAVVEDTGWNSADYFHSDNDDYHIIFGDTSRNLLLVDGPDYTLEYHSDDSKLYKVYTYTAERTEYTGNAGLWSGDDLTLTLKEGFSFTTYAEAGLIMPAGSTLKVDGACSISAPMGDCGVNFTSDGTISGGGTLTSVGKSCGIKAGAGLSISGSVDATGSEYGIYAQGGKVQISGGEVTATAPDGCAAIRARDGITIGAGMSLKSHTGAKVTDGQSTSAQVVMSVGFPVVIGADKTRYDSVPPTPAFTVDNGGVRSGTVDLEEVLPTAPVGAKIELVSSNPYTATVSLDDQEIFSAYFAMQPGDDAGTVAQSIAAALSGMVGYDAEAVGDKLTITRLSGNLTGTMSLELSGTGCPSPNPAGTTAYAAGQQQVVVFTFTTPTDADGGTVTVDSHAVTFEGSVSAANVASGLAAKINEDSTYWTAGASDGTLTMTAKACAANKSISIALGFSGIEGEYNSIALRDGRAPVYATDSYTVGASTAPRTSIISNISLNGNSVRYTSYNNPIGFTGDDYRYVLVSSDNYADFWVSLHFTAQDPATPPPSVASYSVIIAESEGGKVTSSRAQACFGETVALTPAPDEGYKLRSVTAVCAGKDVPVTETDGRYTFTMPAGSVTVTALFEPEWKNPFSDVKEGDWFYDDVAYMCSAGLMEGDGGKVFDPHGVTSRGMIVTVIYRMEGEPPVIGDCPFDDVPAGVYYEKAITWAAANGIVEGYGDGKFGPEDPITREQLVAILYRYAVMKGYDVSVGEDTNILSYNDASDIYEEFIPAFQWACGAGLVEGDAGSLTPRASAERCQIAAIFHRFCENIQDDGT